MPLPILNQRTQPGASDLVRLFLQTEGRWCQHVAEEDAIDVGTAYTNPQLPRVHDANNVMDVAMPEEGMAAAAVEQVLAHYRERGVTCHRWTMNPSVPEGRTKPVVEHLLSMGYRADSTNLMLLDRIPTLRIPAIEGLKVIPARASFKHTRQLFDGAAARWGTPELAEADMLHLDDPHWDALLALKEGEPVAHVGVFAMGEVGRIESMYVAEAHRGKGLGLLMMGRALEICIRSVFRQVMLTVGPTNEGAAALYEKVGFRRIGEITAYFPAGSMPPPVATDQPRP